MKKLRAQLLPVMGPGHFEPREAALMKPAGARLPGAPPGALHDLKQTGRFVPVFPRKNLTLY